MPGVGHRRLTTTEHARYTRFANPVQPQIGQPDDGVESGGSRATPLAGQALRAQSRLPLTSMSIANGIRSFGSDVTPRLDHPEPARDVRPVGQRGVRGGVRTGAVEVRERGRLIDEDTAGQVGRQVYPDVESGPLGGVQNLVVGRVDGRGQSTTAADRSPADLPTL